MNERSDFDLDETLRYRKPGLHVCDCGSDIPGDWAWCTCCTLVDAAGRRLRAAKYREAVRQIATSRLLPKALRDDRTILELGEAGLDLMLDVRLRAGLDIGCIAYAVDRLIAMRGQS